MKKLLIIAVLGLTMSHIVMAAKADASGSGSSQAHHKYDHTYD